MTVSMSAVWDRTTAFLSERFGAIGGIAALAIFLPTLIQECLAPFKTGAAPGIGLAIGVAGLILNIVILWGQLGITALALDPATDPARARAHATSRLPAMIGVAIVLLLGAMVLVVPIVLILAANGVDLTQLGEQGALAALPVGASALIGLYAIVMGIALLFLLARLGVVLAPVVTAERRGLGAIGRSFRLTRGVTWKIVGVLLLFVILLAVASLAVMGVFGTLFSFFAEPGARFSAATFALAVLSAALSAGFSVLATVFGAKLYLALRDREDAAGVAPTYETPAQA